MGALKANLGVVNMFGRPISWGALLIAASLLLIAPANAMIPDTVPLEPDANQPAPGIEIARHLTLITGVAISPLLGVSGVGAWSYFTTPEAERAALPWYANRWFFSLAMGLVLLLNLKEVFLGFFPPAKKIFDALEVMENKLSATVIAAPMLIASTIQMVQNLAQGNYDAADLAGSHPLIGGAFLAIVSPDPAVFLTVLALIICLIAFFVVWLAGHAVNLLILISPFGLIDFMLKIFKYSIMGILLLASILNPYLGALLSLVILFVAAKTVSWTLRLSVFGSALIWDSAGRRHRNFDPSTSDLLAFADGRLGRLATRTYGKVERDSSGRLVFEKRSVFPYRRVREVLPDGDYVISKGLLGPRIILVDDARVFMSSVLTLPPRYRTHEAAVARELGLHHDEKSPLPKRVLGAVSWCRDFFNGGKSPSAAS